MCYVKIIPKFKNKDNDGNELPVFFLIYAGVYSKLKIQ
jgi:hypothetical protein